jgi:LysM repeat protein
MTAAVRLLSRLAAIGSLSLGLGACVTFTEGGYDHSLQAYAQGMADVPDYMADEPAPPSRAESIDTFESSSVRRNTPSPSRDVEVSSLDEPVSRPARTAAAPARKPAPPPGTDPAYHESYGVNVAEDQVAAGDEFVEPASAAPTSDEFGGPARIDGSNKPVARPKKPRTETQTAGKTHTVARGEELSDIAASYDIAEVELIRANGLKPPYKLKNGQKLTIPANAVAAAETPDRKPAAEDPAPAEQPVQAASNSQFSWPLQGKVISGFGPRGKGLYNDGINIQAAKGTPIKAAAAGVVRYAGNELRGYGNLILIEHADGYITAYAHADKLNVRRGDKIKRGQPIATVGQTGNVSSPQLHFEIRKGTKAIDPMTYLKVSS